MTSAGLSPGEAPAAPGPDRDRRRRRSGGPSAPSVLWAAARRPWAVRPPAVLAGLMARGGPADHGHLRRGAGPAGRLLAGGSAVGGGVTSRGRPAGDLRARARHRSATPGQAVAASCAVPGWFAPVPIGGVRYVDGGAHSLTNVAQLARAGLDLDLVLVSAPMGRTGPGGSRGPWRQAARAQLAVEAEVLRRRGVPVVAFQPTAEDQAVMGPDAMDASPQGRRGPPGTGLDPGPPAAAGCGRPPGGPHPVPPHGLAGRRRGLDARPGRGQRSPTALASTAISSTSRSARSSRSGTSSRQATSPKSRMSQ